MRARDWLSAPAAPRETLKEARPGLLQHGFRKRGCRKPSFSGGWTPENSGPSCPTRETLLNQRFLYPCARNLRVSPDPCDGGPGGGPDRRPGPGAESPDGYKSEWCLCPRGPTVPAPPAGPPPSRRPLERPEVELSESWAEDLAALLAQIGHIWPVHRSRGTWSSTPYLVRLAGPGCHTAHPAAPATGGIAPPAVA